MAYDLKGRVLITVEGLENFLEKNKPGDAY